MQQDFSQSGDPRSAGPKPDFDQPDIAYPGSTAEMNPRPDHGEDSYRGLNRLSGKAAIITGADSGIGRAVAIAFAREGADIVLNYLPEEEVDGEETARYVELAGRTAIKVPADLQKEENCHKVVAQAMEKLGRVDVLANIAAFQNTHDSLEEFTTAEIDRTFKTNVYALLWLSKGVLPLMKPGSVIINTSSIQGSDPSPNLIPYAASKSAIISCTKTIAKSAIKQGIRVNAVAPGPVWTPLIPATMPAEKVKSFGKTTLFERPAQPAEIAPVYVFLACDESRYVTAEVYGITGGQSPY